MSLGFVQQRHLNFNLSRCIIIIFIGQFIGITGIKMIKMMLIHDTLKLQPIQPKRWFQLMILLFFEDNMFLKLFVLIDV